MKTDIRFAQPQDHDTSFKKASDIVANCYVMNPILKRGTVSSLITLLDIAGMTEDSTRDLFNKYIQIANSMGIKINGHHRGGVDSYRLALPGKKLLSGIGPAGDGMHTEAEYLNLELTRNKLALDLELVKELLK